MKKFLAICASAIALISPAIAQAQSTFSPGGTYTFSGTLGVKKNLSSVTNCTVTAVVTVPSGGSTAPTATASVSGGGVCSAITISGSPFTVTSDGTYVFISGVRIDIAPVLIFPADACEGTLTAIWGGNSASPRELIFSVPDSNVPDANPDNFGATENDCELSGTLYQTSPSSPGLDIN